MWLQFNFFYKYPLVISFPLNNLHDNQSTVWVPHNLHTHPFSNKVFAQYVSITMDEMINNLSTTSMVNPALQCASLIGLLDLANWSNQEPNVLKNQTEKFISLIQLVLDKVSAVIAQHAEKFKENLLSYLGGDEQHKRSVFYSRYSLVLCHTELIKVTDAAVPNQE